MGTTDKAQVHNDKHLLIVSDKKAKSKRPCKGVYQEHERLTRSTKPILDVPLLYHEKSMMQEITSTLAGVSPEEERGEDASSVIVSTLSPCVFVKVISGSERTS